MVLAAEKVVASPLTLTDWIVAAAVLAAGLLAGQIARRLVFRTVGTVGSAKNEDEEPLALQVVGRFITTLTVVAALLYALSILGIRLGPLIGALGIGGIAIAFASQSILANFLASVILQVRRAFRHGDLIETNECEGTVEDINFRTVVLRTYDGERVMVPCAEVLSKPIINYSTLGRRRTTLEIGVRYDTDLDLARDVLLQAAQKVDGVRSQPPVEVWVESFGESSIDLVVRFWHAPDVPTMWRVRSGVAVACKRALDEAGIEIPFPQRVLYFGDARPGDRHHEGERATSDVY
jgi:small conductance mechanosensitive channel